jgi:two-component system C4-dicarboxylate transport sensor histidine kinase DctB
MPLLDAQQPIAFDGWVLHLMVDPSPRVEAAIANGRLMLFGTMTLLLALFAAWLYLRRQRKISADAILAERTRTLREQLTQANRLATLGQVSAGVAHEISQPVAAARVFAENGKKLISAGQTNTAVLNFTKIVELTERIGRITEELRRFSRKQVSEPKAMDVNRAIDGALLLLRDRIDSLGVEIAMPDAADTAVTVQAEHVRLEQVLVNLLQNALDAVGRHGRITITLETDKTRCLLTVCDNGPGIDTTQFSQLFQPFATTKQDGLGLGLVISRDIMRDLGGDLTAISSETGACFSMQIPRT